MLLKGGTGGIVIPTNEIVTLIYDGDQQRWVVVGRTAQKTLGYYQNNGLRLIGENSVSMQFASAFYPSYYLQVYNSGGSTNGIYLGLQGYSMRMTNSVAGINFSAPMKYANINYSDIFVYNDNNVARMVARSGDGMFYNLTDPDQTIYGTLNVSDDFFVNDSVGIKTSTPQNTLNVIGEVNASQFIVNASVGYSGYCINTTYLGGIATSCND